MQSPAVTAAFEAARQIYPGVGVDVERFAERLRERGVGDEILAARGADLLLAFACADGDRRAIVHFEEQLLPQVNLFVARYGLPADAADEVRQKVRVKLLMGSPPGILQYQGRGPLGAWVRITALRFALELARSRSPVAAVGVGAADLLDFCFDPDAGPEAAAARTLYRDRLLGALEVSLRALTPRDRTLLRLYVVDALNIDAIGAMYHVHRATVARWLAGVRTRVFDGVREHLDLKRQPSPSEMRSLVALLENEIQISARRILAADGP